MSIIKESEGFLRSRRSHACGSPRTILVFGFLLLLWGAVVAFAAYSVWWSRAFNQSRLYEPVPPLGLPIELTLLASATLLAGIGCLRCRRWGWELTLASSGYLLGRWIATGLLWLGTLFDEAPIPEWLQWAAFALALPIGLLWLTLRALQRPEVRASCGAAGVPVTGRVTLAASAAIPMALVHWFMV